MLFILSTISSLLGIIFFYTNIPIGLLICTCILLMDTLYEFITGRLKGFFTTILSITIGIIIASFGDRALLEYVCVCLCFESLLSGILGLIFMPKLNKNSKNKIKNIALTKFYMFITILGLVIYLISIPNLITSTTNIYNLMNSIICIILFFITLLFVFFYYRKSSNTYTLFLIHHISNTIYSTVICLVFATNYIEIISRLLGLAFGYCIWSIPYIIYFKQRKELFYKNYNDFEKLPKYTSKNNIKIKDVRDILNKEYMPVKAYFIGKISPYSDRYVCNKKEIYNYLKDYLYDYTSRTNKKIKYVENPWELQEETNDESTT